MTTELRKDVVKNQSEAEERENIGMDMLHHMLDPILDCDMEDFVDLFSDDDDEIDAICDEMCNIQEHEHGLRNFILYNAHTTFRMCSYLLEKYYFILSAADSKGIDIPEEVIEPMKNNIGPMIDFMEGIDQENSVDWFIKFLLIGLNPFADDYDPVLAKKMGERALELYGDINE